MLSVCVCVCQQMCMWLYSEPVEQMLGAQLTNDFGGFPNEMWNGLFSTEISKQGSKNKVCAKSLISKDDKNISRAALSFSLQVQYAEGLSECVGFQ